MRAGERKDLGETNEEHEEAVHLPPVWLEARRMEAARMQPGGHLSAFHSLWGPQPLLLDSERQKELNDFKTEFLEPREGRQHAQITQQEQTQDKNQDLLTPTRAFLLPPARSPSPASSSQG